MGRPYLCPRGARNRYEEKLGIYEWISDEVGPVRIISCIVL